MDHCLLSEKLLRLTSGSADQLERWMGLFEADMAAAESLEEAPELKDLVALLTAIKRILEILRVAELMHPDSAAHGQLPAVDPEALRRILSEED